MKFVTVDQGPNLFLFFRRGWPASPSLHRRPRWVLSPLREQEQPWKTATGHAMAPQETGAVVIFHNDSDPSYWRQAVGWPPFHPSAAFAYADTDLLRLLYD